MELDSAGGATALPQKQEPAEADRAPTGRLFVVRSGRVQLVFTEGGRFAGMASPASVRHALCVVFPPLAAFQAAMEEPVVPPPQTAADDVEQETRRWADRWRAEMPGEGGLKVDVRRSLLQLWLGERLVTRCIEAGTELTTIDVQQIVDSRLADVPIERPPRVARGATAPPEPSAREIVIVSRDAFAVQLARQ